ncbi:type IX secretion system membrane protein PorP/SprF [Mucilaginibacter sp. SP1R1]|uniref:PorP/SprF family type IX secretion system membrane protein n=1 Tax=Mucilaginibacter sp. SP1R1 TaxID=2723091 RepID=UPI001617B824|nr:type IX secretion system membrane protein PorP/SprF [Mucilaginibacter sp. SP1R1]MBB6148272.1 type IX secretion system PorP/SprF family membrane protein [Mucilaginibacter sp. SP1R1]
MKKISILLILAVFSVQLVSAQQDAQFSQYMFNGIYINPAYAGYKEQLNIQSFYRSQWTGIPGAPKTISLAVDAIANDNKVGLALQVSSDRLGAQSNLAAYANYAYRLQMNDDGSARLALGLGVGAIQLGIDGSKLNPNDPEPYQPLGMQSTIVADARTGVYYSDNRYYAGLSADNLVSQFFKVNSYSFIPQPKPHYYLTAGMLVPLSEDLLLKPSFLLKDDMAGPTSLDLSAFFILGDKIWIGCSYRTGVKLYEKSYLQSDLTSDNSLVAAVQLFSLKNFRIGYAYDISIGPLQGYSNGTHEISIGYFFDTKSSRMLTPRYF